MGRAFERTNNAAGVVIVTWFAEDLSTEEANRVGAKTIVFAGTFCAARFRSARAIAKARPSGTTIASSSAVEVMIEKAICASVSSCARRD